MDEKKYIGYIGYIFATYYVHEERLWPHNEISNFTLYESLLRWFLTPIRYNAQEEIPNNAIGGKFSYTVCRILSSKFNKLTL